MKDITAIIPAYNEADNINLVIKDLNAVGIQNIIISIDVQTDDNTIEVLNGLKVKSVVSKKSGYDPTVLSGIQAIAKNFPKTKYVLFADAGRKYSFSVVKKFYEKIDNCDLVLGIRNDANNTMLWHQKLGTQLVLFFINFIFNSKICDITPFRLVSLGFLNKLNLVGAKFQLPTEMLVKALSLDAKIEQVEIASKQRIGNSKVSGKLYNSLRAGFEMLLAIRHSNYGKKIN